MVKILGHRATLSEGIYENTIPAIKHALKYVDGLETDIVMTSENGIFLIHDNMFMYDHAEYLLYSHLNKESRKAAGTRRTDEMTNQELKALRTVTNDPIPEFTELLDLASGRPAFILNLELKSDLCALLTLECLNPYIKSGKIIKEQIIFSSFNHPELLKIREADSDYKIGTLIEPSDRVSTLIYPWSNNKSSIYQTFSPEILDNPLIKNIRPEFFCIENDDFTAENVGLIQQKFPGSQIMIWYSYREPPPSENTALDKKRETLDEHLYAIVTNYPKAMKEHHLIQQEQQSKSLSA